MRFGSRPTTSLIVWCTVLLLGVACAETRPVAPMAEARPDPTLVVNEPVPTRSAVAPAASATVVPSPTQTATAATTPSAEPSRPMPLAGSGTLPPLEPLADTVIVDRPMRGVRAATDGSRKYLLAAWAPAAPLVALVPQDGPGMDVVNVDTGKVEAVVTDTYVLEPQWTDGGELLVHRVEGDQDTLRLYRPGRGLTAPLVAGAPLRAPAYGAGMVAFGREDRLLVCSPPCDDPAAVATTGALGTALVSQGARRALLAWTPEVANLEDVQTLVVPIGNGPAGVDLGEAWPVSMPGEGWWLPRWSPDGSHLALTSVEGRIAVVAADGSKRQDLGPGDAPAWSPDGTRIAYAGASAGLDYTTRDVHVVRADGQGPRLRLTDAGEEQLYVSPSWSPDGNQLAFVELDSGQLYIGTLTEP